MKGILLAGGSGSRLYPLTQGISKQLLNVYDKPVIYYPLSILMLADIKDILIISTERDLPLIENSLGDGSRFGIKLSYKVQKEPKGIAEAFLIGKDFIANESVCLILGDNIFYGRDLVKLLVESTNVQQGANVFAYRVEDPQRFGVVEFDTNYKAISIEEKPKNPKSRWAVTGLYFYDENVVEYTQSLKPSVRGELEITDLNKKYLEKGRLHVKTFGRGTAWLDAGTADSLIEASLFVQTIEKRQGLKIACLEEVAFYKKFISKDQLTEIISAMPNCSYQDYLEKQVLPSPINF